MLGVTGELHPNLAALDSIRVGESVTISKPMRLDQLLSHGEEIATAMNNLRSFASSIISDHRRNDIDGKEFTTHSARALTSDPNLMLLVVNIERLA